MSSGLVLADTHLTAARASTLIDILGHRLTLADGIIHAGDIVCAEVLELLARYAPSTAVKGNNDVGLDLPDTTVVDIDEQCVAIVRRRPGHR